MTNIAEAPTPTTIVFGTDGWRAKIADDFNVKNEVYKQAQDVESYIDPSLTNAVQ